MTLRRATHNIINLLFRTLDVNMSGFVFACTRDYVLRNLHFIYLSVSTMQFQAKGKPRATLESKTLQLEKKASCRIFSQ